MADRNRKLSQATVSVTASLFALAAASPAFAGTSTATDVNGNAADAVTLSLSGSTALSAFTRGAGFTFLEPGTSITLGPVGNERTYTAGTGASTVQLAASDFTPGNYTPVPVAGGSSPVQNTSVGYGALRVEWHEQGSVEGVLELADSQINEGIFDNNATAAYNPNTATGVFINQSKFGGTSPNAALNPPSSATFKGHTLATFQSATDRTTSQIQNRVQMGISDVTTAQGFSTSGSAGAFNLTPGTPGYGKGNPALAASANLTGVGLAKQRQELQDTTKLNMVAGATDPNPAPGAPSTYATGPWNTAGVGNVDNKTVAITATTFAANPGTGLEHLNRTDAQWLQTTGRLQNGADFNVTTRNVNSGTRNVAALNTGVDPSFAAGENDGGAAVGAQDLIGPNMKFSNKDSGGSNLRPTLQNNRMAVGTLSLSDYKNSGGGADNGSRALRALDYVDSPNDPAAGTGNTSETFGSTTFTTSRGGYTPVNALTIVEGKYVVYQNETYVTVKTPGATNSNESVTSWTAKTDSVTGIKGDNTGHDVADVRQNVLNSVANFPDSSISNPGDQLLANSFILPQLMQVRKDMDGINKSTTNVFDATTNPKGTYNSTRSGQFLGSTLADKFATTDPGLIKAGASAGTYGNISPSQGAVAITGSNYMFGNFNQTGTRDYSAVVTTALAAQTALFKSGHGVDMQAGDANNSDVSGLPGSLSAMTGFNGTAGAKKGDLIVMGDYDGSGTFDGKDLYLMARGASLADSNASTTLTTASGATFADQARRGVLRKNAALDALQTATNAVAIDDGNNGARLAQRTSAAVNGTATAIANAFNKFDVNRDGIVDRKDASIVDKFVGASYTNLADSIGATINSDGKANGSSPVPVSLVDVELTDAGQTINGKFSNILRDDFNLIKNAEITSGVLTQGDVNFDGFTESQDLLVVLNHFGAEADSSQLSQWSTGDVTGDGFVESADLLAVLNNFGSEASALAAFSKMNLSSYDIAFDSADNKFVAVPEPTSLGLAGMAMGGLLLSRRRRRSELQH